MQKFCLIWRGCDPPSLPPRGCARRRVSERNRRRRLLARRLKVAPQGRMRGEPAAAVRERVISESPPLISQRSGPLTASPKGEANAIAKKLIRRGCEPPKPSPMGEGGPAGPDEGRACRGNPLTGYIGKSAPHQSAVGAADSFPRGGSRSMEKICKNPIDTPLLLW